VEEPVDKRLSTRTVVSALIACAAGFLFVASNQTAEGTNLRTGGVEDLRGLIIDRVGKVSAESNKLAAIQAEVDRISATKVDPALTARINALEEAAGLKPLTGSALVVTLNDAPYTPGATLPDGVVPDDLVVHQQDVQAVVNAMWRGGAAGVMVMDQRISSTTAIRCVGNTLLMQGRVYSPPFVVTGVGNVSDLQQAVDAEPGVVIFKQYVEALDLGWKLAILQETTLPAWQGSLS
jgi:uncharacterized protein YlxW (UPF0749 family)